MTEQHRLLAYAAAQRAGAYSPEQVISVMSGVEPAITPDKMDDWCETLKKNWPCLFWGKVGF